MGFSIDSHQVSASEDLVVVCGPASGDGRLNHGLPTNCFDELKQSRASSPRMPLLSECHSILKHC
jgi:hypothetical protein